MQIFIESLKLYFTLILRIDLNLGGYFMNSSQLKIFAMIAMLLDHIAWILFPNIAIFHIIGKLAFPIFCFMIAEGYIKTRNRKKYLIRLLLIAVISQIPFLMAFKLAFGNQMSGFNTIFDLALGLIAIWIYDKKDSKYTLLAVWVISISAWILQIDGDFAGIWLIYFFFKYHNDFKTMAKKVCMLTVLETIIYIAQIFIMNFTNGQPLDLCLSYAFSFNTLECLLSILALVPIKFYTGKKGLNIKWLFYIFYPAHLLILYEIRVFLM